QVPIAFFVPRTTSSSHIAKCWLYTTVPDPEIAIGSFSAAVQNLLNFAEYLDELDDWKTYENLINR
ncbi:MAG: hypothetical protein O7D30_11690, partial [Rickettsia endosymbiont of Ixodes persulcatus]|nr:hypothetical protein [Rickettsia endosymbiont of Ixodes persulcatus]